MEPWFSAHLLSNAPWTGSGYGIQTRHLIKRFPLAGIKTSMTAYCGLEFSAIPVNGVNVYPRSRDQYGNDVLIADARNEGAQITIPITDLWVLEADILRQANACPVIPIDHKYAPPRVISAAAHCLQPIAMSEFGQRALIEQGIPALYVPHMVDMNEIYAIPQDEARKTLGFPTEGNVFIIGIVGHNKGTPSRKNFSGMIRAIGEFIRLSPDVTVIVYLHTEILGLEGEAIEPMLRDAQIPMSSVRFVDQYRLARGSLKSDYMRSIYSAMDVLLHATKGEGFGVTQIEAMACGTPVISTDFTAMPEIVKRGAGWLVPVAYEEWTWQESYLGYPSIDGIVEALGKACAARGDMTLREKAIAGMRENYDADLVLEKHWLPVLRQIKDMIEPSTPRSLTDPRRKLSIITPWIDHPELIKEYEQAVMGAEVIIIDNGSTKENAALIHGMVERLGGIYIRNASNVGFGEANNQGLKVASGDVVLFMNNDVQATMAGFVGLVLHDVKDGALYGPELRQWDVDGEPVDYINGHCVAATKWTWDILGGWNTEDYKLAYFEDTALSWDAQQRGFKLLRRNWPLLHLGNRTSLEMPETAFRYFEQNQAAFFKRVREDRKVRSENVA